MVIKTAYPLQADGKSRVKYASDSGLFLRNVATGEVYDEAVELAETAVQYREVARDENE